MRFGVRVCLGARLHRPHGPDESKAPARTENVAEVASPGAAALNQRASLQLTPGLSAGHQQHLLAAEARTHQSYAEPNVEHDDQEQLQPRDASWWGENV